MAIAADRIRHLLLPSRIKSLTQGMDSSLARLLLADRLVALPDIITVEREAEASRFSVDLFLSQPAKSTKKPLMPIPFCGIDRDGIELFGLEDSDGYYVLSKGWASHRSVGLVLHLPRNEDEVDCCWLILSRAYQLLKEQAGNMRAVRSMSSWSFPNFSRTNLQ